MAMTFVVKGGGWITHHTTFLSLLEWQCSPRVESFLTIGLQHILMDKFVPKGPHQLDLFPRPMQVDDVKRDGTTDVIMAVRARGNSQSCAHFLSSPMPTHNCLKKQQVQNTCWLISGLTTSFTAPQISAQDNLSESQRMRSQGPGCGARTQKLLPFGTS